MESQENNMTSLEEFTAVSKRTGVNIEDLRQLPAESLTAYYNKTSTLASGGWAVVSAVAALTTAVAAGLCFNNSEGGFLTALGMGNALFSALNWTLAASSFYGLINNQEESGKIQSEIASMTSEDKPPVVKGKTEVPLMQAGHS